MKKSFVIYSDIIELVSELSDQQLGQLFRSILEFVNFGTQKEFEELALRILFKQTTMQISRDLDRYDSKCKQMQANASKSKRKASRSKQIGSDTVTVTVTDTDIDTVTEIENETLRASYSNFLKFRASKKKKVSGFARKKQIEFLKKFPIETATAMIDQSIMNDWQGLFELKNGNAQPQKRIDKTKPDPEIYTDMKLYKIDFDKWKATLT